MFSTGFDKCGVYFLSYILLILFKNIGNSLWDDYGLIAGVAMNRRISVNKNETKIVKMVKS